MPRNARRSAPEPTLARLLRGGARLASALEGAGAVLAANVVALEAELRRLTTPPR